MNSIARSGGIGVSVTYQVMTGPGMRNIGPPYSQAQFPGGSWSSEKKESPFSAASRGVFAVGSSGRPCECRNQHKPHAMVAQRLTAPTMISIYDLYIPSPCPRSTCPLHSVATPLPPLHSVSSAMFDTPYHPSASILCSLSSGFHMYRSSRRLELVHGRLPPVWHDRSWHRLPCHWLRGA